MTQYNILVIDDNRAIHEDFRKIFHTRPANSQLDDMAADLFGDAPPVSQRLPDTQFTLSFAAQGKEGFALANQARAAGAPFALAFVDMRMPPGWDGLETIEAIWKEDAAIHAVICTAYSDHSWSDITGRLGRTDRLLVIKKPFDAVEIVQCAHAMCEKWRLEQLDRLRVAELEATVEQRTKHLVEANSLLQIEMLARQQIEVELRHAQKMEAVGQLAAGIAHEINTPIQFVGNSLTFLQESFDESLKLIRAYREAMAASAQGESSAGLASRVRDAEEDADIDYVAEKAPAAFERAKGGLERVARIVRAMKEFAHPGTNEQQPSDINRAIETTLEVAHGEYKMVADIVTQLGDIPEVTCSVGDINQVILNLVVNAAHAITERTKGQGRGTITLTTIQRGDEVLIKVSDTGSGIPAAIRDKIFDPFFTTKGVGKGTGQGLSIAHSVVVDKHRGKLFVESEEAVGTTFTISLPICGRRSVAPVA